MKLICDSSWSITHLLLKALLIIINERRTVLERRGVLLQMLEMPNSLLKLSNIHKGSDEVLCGAVRTMSFGFLFTEPELCRKKFFILSHTWPPAACGPRGNIRWFFQKRVKYKGLLLNYFQFQLGLCYICNIELNLIPGLKEVWNLPSGSDPLAQELLTLLTSWQKCKFICYSVNWPWMFLFSKYLLFDFVFVEA